MKTGFLAVVVVAVLGLAGCASDTGRSVVGGAGLGAAAGAAIGAITGGDPGKGAAIGAAVGATAGVLKEEYEARTGRDVQTCRDRYGSYPCDAQGNELVLCEDRRGREYYCYPDERRGYDRGYDRYGDRY